MPTKIHRRKLGGLELIEQRAEELVRRALEIARGGRYDAVIYPHGMVRAAERRTYRQPGELYRVHAPIEYGPGWRDPGRDDAEWDAWLHEGRELQRHALLLRERARRL